MLASFTVTFRHRCERHVVQTVPTARVHTAAHVEQQEHQHSPPSPYVPCKHSSGVHLNAPLGHSYLHSGRESLRQGVSMVLPGRGNTNPCFTPTDWYRREVFFI